MERVDREVEERKKGREEEKEIRRKGIGREEEG